MLRNTTSYYGSIAKWLHWLTAIGFLATYISVYYRHWFTVPKTDPNLTALHLHLSFGISIGIFVALRIIWRLANPSPQPAPGSWWEHLAAKAGHLALYFFMIAMPLTGYLGTHDDTQFFFLFNVPQFAHTPLFDWWVVDQLGMTFKEFEKPIDFFHKQIGGQYLVWMLIVIHVLAAFYHHWFKRDDTLTKMLPVKA